MTVPVFRAHVVNGLIAADGAAGRPAGAATIVALLYFALGDAPDRADSAARAVTVSAAA